MATIDLAALKAIEGFEGLDLEAVQVVADVPRVQRSTSGKYQHLIPFVPTDGTSLELPFASKEETKTFVGGMRGWVARQEKAAESRGNAVEHYYKVSEVGNTAYVFAEQDIMEEDEGPRDDN